MINTGKNRAFNVDESLHHVTKIVATMLGISLKDFVSQAVKCKIADENLEYLLHTPKR